MKMLTVNLFYCCVVAPPFGPFPPVFGSFYSVGASSRFCKLLQRSPFGERRALLLSRWRPVSLRAPANGARRRISALGTRQRGAVNGSHAQAVSCGEHGLVFVTLSVEKRRCLWGELSLQVLNPPSVFTIMLGLVAPRACDLLLMQTLLFMPTAFLHHFHLFYLNLQDSHSLSSAACSNSSHQSERRQISN